MTNNGTLQRDITIQGQKLEIVDHFKYIGAIICDNGSRREVLSRAAQTMASLARLKTIWKDNMAHNWQEWRELTRKSITTRPYGSSRN